MTYLKTISAASAAAFVVLLLCVAGSASATALCEENKSPCPEGKSYAAGTLIAATAPGKLKLSAPPLGTVECDSEIEGKWQVDPYGEFTTGTITKLTLAKCAEPPPGFACGAGTTALNLPYRIGAVAATGGGSGTVALVNDGSGQPSLKFECPSVNCTFKANEILLTVTAGKPASAEPAASKTEWEGSKCPVVAPTLTGKYIFTKPATEFAVESGVAPPVLCKINVVPCAPPAEIYPVPSTFTGQLAAEARFSYTYLGETREPTCKISKFTMSTTTAGKPLLGEVTALNFENCAGGACNVTALNTPYRSEIQRTGGGNGTAAWSQASSGEPTFKIKCGLTEECVYKVPEIDWTLTGGLTATLSAASGVSLTGSSVGCSSTATWQGVGGVTQVKYNFTAPNASVFVHS